MLNFYRFRLLISAANRHVVTTLFCVVFEKVFCEATCDFYHLQVPLVFEETYEHRAAMGPHSKLTLKSVHTVNTARSLNASGSAQCVRKFEIYDYLTTGMSFGELCMLTGEVFNFQVVCESSVQVGSQAVLHIFFNY
jgi:hypothetical protein